VIQAGLRPMRFYGDEVAVFNGLRGGVGGLDDGGTAPSSYSYRSRPVRKGGRVVAGRQRWAGVHPGELCLVLRAGDEGGRRPAAVQLVRINVASAAAWPTRSGVSTVAAGC